MENLVSSNDFIEWRWFFLTGSVEEEQSLELLVVLYNKFGMNDKAVAAITASLSLISAGQSATGGDPTVQRKRYSLLLQHLKESLAKGPPDSVDKTNLVAEAGKAQKGKSKGDSMKSRSSAVVDSGFSQSSDNRAKVSSIQFLPLK